MSHPADWEQFSGLNAAYLFDLYEQYLAGTADPETRAFFERYGPPPLLLEQAPELLLESQVSFEKLYAAARQTELVAGAVALANAIRAYGYRAAQLDPLGSDPPGDADLLPETHGIREEDLAALPAAIVGGPAAERAGATAAGARSPR